MIDDSGVFVAVRCLSNMHYNMAMVWPYVVDLRDPSDGYFLRINYDNVGIVHPIGSVNATIETILATVKAMDQLVTTFHILYYRPHFPLIFFQQRGKEEI